MDRLDQIAPLSSTCGSPKGSQTELAKRLGVSKQVISHSEKEDYQDVVIARLHSILDALEIEPG